MATVINGNQVKTNDGKIIQAQNGGWYDGQQFVNGTLSQAGVINPQSNQQGAGQAVSKEVIAQTNPNNVQYIQQQQAQPQQAPQPGGVGSFSANGGDGGGMISTGIGLPVAPAIDLEGLYKKYQDESGISDLEKQLSTHIDEYNKAHAAINDDPFLAEGNRVGRVQKLSTDFDNRIANLKNDITTKKADIEMHMQLAQKQFDINSQQAQQAFSQFQSLLEDGALDNASGDSIASITRATGITSDMISAAVKASKAKNATKPQMIQYDDGVNQGFALINPDTGEIIKQQSIAASTKNSGGSGGGSLLNEGRQFDLDQKQAPALAAQAAKSGKNLRDMLSFYSQWLDPQQIYTIYNTNSIYGAAKEDKKTLATLGIKK